MVCDLSYRESVKFTYERDGGLVHSWIDHVVCSESLSSRITDVHSVSSGANMSDHLPLSFQLHIPCASINTLPSSVSSKPKACINWSKVTPSTVMMYQQMVLGKLADPPVEFLNVPRHHALFTQVYLTTMQATLCLLFWIVLAVVSLAILHPN